MLSRLFGKKTVPLAGAPAVRRQKTYSAQSGYVYQYFYEGHRPSTAERGTEYVFDVSSDRKTSSPVSVVIADSAIASWQNESGRTLSATEQYAIAKMALFQAFDERESPEAMREVIHVASRDVPAILAALHID
ncbi:MAG TPA: hypothetical protein VNH83_20350 [Bryobacteraceae bacterium]|nr:hypothetical protein [Bryobacteraceae bacterium]